MQTLSGLSVADTCFIDLAINLIKAIVIRVAFILAIITFINNGIVIDELN